MEPLIKLMWNILRYDAPVQAQETHIEKAHCVRPYNALAYSAFSVLTVVSLSFLLDQHTFLNLF